MGDPTASAPRSRSAQALRVAYWLVALASVVWTTVNRDRFAAEMDEAAGSIGPLVGFMAALVVVWVLGLVVACFCAAARTASSIYRDPLAWVRSFHDLGHASNGVLADLAHSPAFWIGWWVSWVATTLFSLVPAVLAIVRLGWSGLGLVGFAFVSIAVNLSWRMPLEIRLRRLRAASGHARPARRAGRVGSLQVDVAEDADVVLVGRRDHGGHHVGRLGGAALEHPAQVLADDP